MRPYTDLLRGVRVVELCWAWAGPFACRMLGDLGADVIKVEGPSRPDGVRFGTYPNNEAGHEPWNRGAHFQKHSRNKRSLVVDLNSEAGRDVFKRLIAKADVFIESNSPRVLPNLGLTYDDLVKVNPRLIMMSMPGFGSTGPARDWLAYGINLEAFCGLSSVTGYADAGPVRSVIPYGDPIAALQAAITVLAAIHSARKSGHGRHIEIAQSDSLLNLLIEPMFWSALTGRSTSPDGCHHDYLSPHGVFPVLGDDRWVCLLARTYEEFQAIAHVVGHPEWNDDPALVTSLGRKEHEAMLDSAVSEWTSTRELDDVVQAFRAASVPVEPARRVDEIVDDPLLARRGYWTEIDHPVTGRLPYSYLPWRYWRSTPKTPEPAPVFGQHNREILETVVGMSPREVRSLVERGVVASIPNMA